MKRSCEIDALKKECPAASVPQALRLHKDNRVYKVKNLPGEGWTGFVMNQQGIPYQAWWEERTDSLEFACECASPLPCVHVLALGHALDARSEIYSKDLKSFLHKDSSGKALREERRNAISRGQGTELDLFDEGLDQPSLFDLPPPPPKTKGKGASADKPRQEDSLYGGGGFFDSDSGAEAVKEPDALDRTEKDSPSDLPQPAAGQAQVAPPPETVQAPLPGGKEKPAAAPLQEAPGRSTEPEAAIPAKAVPKTAKEIWSLSLHPSFPHRPELVAEIRRGDPLYAYNFDQAGADWWQQGRMMEQLFQSIENTQKRRVPLGDVLSMAWKEALHDGRDPVQIIQALPLQGVGRSSGRVIMGSGIEVHARQTDKAQKESCSLEARLVCPVFLADAAACTDEDGPKVGDAEADREETFRPLVHWVAEGSWLYWFRTGDASLSVLRNLDASRWMRQAQAPGRMLSLSQAMALRERGLASLADILAFPPPDGEESIYETVEPRAFISIQGNPDRTEVFLSFSYKGVETSFRDEADFVSRRLKGGLTLIHPRDKEKENRCLMELKSRLEDLILFEGGLYAGLVSGSGPAADFSLNLGFSQFLLDHGKDLMEQGFELRYEGSPIRVSSGLSFRAESGMDWFGLRAQWLEPGSSADSQGSQLPTGHVSGPLDQDGNPLPGYGDHSLLIDDSLDNTGLSASKDSEGKDCWILLAQRDLDRIKVLRHLGMDKHGLLETSPVNLTLIESLYQDIENKDESGVRRAQELMHDLAQTHPQWGTGDIPGISQPKGLRAELRSYQLSGYNWLLSLHRHELGGCLADDMGLGKTVQTIALLQHLKETGTLGPSLLITPVVTLANWEEEVARFAPDLCLYRHTGSTRVRSLDELLNPPLDGSRGRPDIILVSYHTLRNDLDLFVTQVWDYVILDEAHYIKNAQSQLFKAVKVLKSRHRLSLTGTPIENSTMELWSQFNFLNPGLLGTKRQFQTQVAAKIEKDLDEDARDQLRATIKPFLLRRKKEDVLADLPPKEEIFYWTEMDKEQSKIYTAHREEFKARLGGLLDRQGLDQSRMEVLRFMLRLRQLAIHPGMIKEADGRRPFAHIPSCKQDALSMLLEESVQEDHKILVFSQFVSALRLIGEQLDVQGRRYQLLSGESKDRGEMVRKFRDDEDLRIFLLSLKAGGVGINLTQADYVVLFDPWWNPAAEQQAVDRAHRMGQKRPVIVYKFITRGTIEEKIVLLQKKKHSLAGSLISDEEGMLSQFNEEELMELFSDSGPL